MALSPCICLRRKENEFCDGGCIYNKAELTESGDQDTIENTEESIGEHSGSSPDDPTSSWMQRTLENPC